MKFFSFILFFLLAFGSLATAQASFLILEDSVSSSISLPETTAAAENWVKNVSGAPLSVKWRRYEISLTPGCVTQVCDPNRCYEPAVSSKIFLLETDSSALMRVDLVSENPAPADAIVRLQFTNAAEPSDTASAYYFLSIGTSGVKEETASLRIGLYPNPVAESFLLDHADAVKTLRLYNQTGQQVAVFEATPSQRYALTNQPAGTYFVALEDHAGRVIRALQIVKE